MLFTSDYSIKMPFGRAIMTAVLGVLTVVFILAVIDLLIIFVSKIIRLFQKEEAETTVSVQDKNEKTQTDPQSNFQNELPETESAGTVDLFETDEATAAVIMAILSFHTAVPLNHMDFKSIKLLPEENE